jgi:protein-S-isoprenylcysteine O-methyltransferase Ste14
MNGIIWISAAAALYAALHSVLASNWSKRAVRRALGDSSQRYYRFIYNVISVITFMPILGIVALEPGMLLYRIPFPWSILFTLGQGCAALLILIGLLQTDMWHFFGLRQLAPGHDGETPEFKVSGLYQAVRHPLYTAGLLFIWFMPIMTTTTLALTITLSAYLFLGSYFEERRLVAEFGGAYREYQSSVPRMIPSWKTFRNNPIGDGAE